MASYGRERPGRKGRELDGRGRRSQLSAPAGLEQEFTSARHHGHRAGLSGQGRFEQGEWPGGDAAGREEAVHWIARNRGTGGWPGSDGKTLAIADFKSFDWRLLTNTERRLFELIDD